MKGINNGNKMKNVWTIPAPNGNKKKFGKHPTQKLIQLLERIILASTKDNNLIFDPFSGSSIIGLATIKLKRYFIGYELEGDYISISVKRLENLLKT